MILIIDDDSAVRSSLSFMLKRAGYEVKTAPGPREAMDIVRAEAPALILMDMNFTLSTTGEEGLTLLKQVKVFRPDVPVILMTAWGSIQLAVQGMQAGAFDFITKPWNNAALLQRIETALELTAAPKEVPEEQTTALNRIRRKTGSIFRQETGSAVPEISRVDVWEKFWSYCLESRNFISEIKNFPCFLGRCFRQLRIRQRSRQRDLRWMSIVRRSRKYRSILIFPRMRSSPAR